jgi:hypothetical protein
VTLQIEIGKIKEPALECYCLATCVVQARNPKSLRVFTEGYGGQNGTQNDSTWRIGVVKDQRARFVLLWAQGQALYSASHVKPFDQVPEVPVAETKQGTCFLPTTAPGPIHCFLYIHPSV